MAQHSLISTRNFKTGQAVLERGSMSFSIYDCIFLKPCMPASLPRVTHIPRAEKVQHS